MKTQRFGVALLASSLTYQGEALALQLAVVNQSPRELSVAFSTTQRYDFALLDHEGREYWRWSDGRAFDPAVEMLTVPGGPQGGFHLFGEELERLPLPQERGDFVTLVGELPAQDMPFQARLRIELDL